jgi:hypothetical protein
MTAARSAFVVLVLAWLAYKFSGIGWVEVWESRPRTIWFYLCWFGLYIQLPVVEALVYRVLWNLPVRESLVPLLHKRTLNQDVVAGSGEAFFFLWARPRVGMSTGQIAGTLKDAVIASSFAYWSSIGIFVLLARRFVLSALYTVSGPQVVAVGAALFFVLLILGIKLRRKILTLSPSTVVRLFFVHFGRLVLLVYLLQVLQWWVELPAVTLGMWVVMLVVITVVNRIPFIPARDLVGIGTVLSVLALPASYEPAIAAMLLMRTVLDKTSNLAVWTASLVIDRRSGAVASK